MDVTEENTALLRMYLGETVPDGGSEDDSMFSTVQLEVMLQSARTINHAIIAGWEIKLAHWSNLVDVTDGAASRKLGDLMAHAENMIDYYRKKTGAGPDDSLARSRTRVGKIIRSY